MNKQHEKSALLLSLVDGIREGWRRMRGEAVKKVTDKKHSTLDPPASINKKDTHLAENVCQVKYRVERESQTSFEKFLRSLPKVDTVDRTVDWVLAQPDSIEERESDRYANLSNCILPRPEGGASLNEDRMQRMDALQQFEVPSSRMSLSRYESERGTVGRGTPPTQGDNEPRLDLLLQQMHKRQERKAVQMLRLDRQHKRNSLKSGHYSYRKHSDICAGGDMVMCEWGRCRVAPMTTRELTTHINEHIFLERPGAQQVLQCRWRGCTLMGRGWTSRISLQQHVYDIHCNHVPWHIGPRQISDSADVERLAVNMNIGRKHTSPKLTMVTGLQIRPAAVVSREHDRAGRRK